MEAGEGIAAGRTNMHFIKKNRFVDVQGFEMGFAPIGKPIMTVFF